MKRKTNKKAVQPYVMPKIGATFMQPGEAAVIDFSTNRNPLFWPFACADFSSCITTQPTFWEPQCPIVIIDHATGRYLTRMTR